MRVYRCGVGLEGLGVVSMLGLYLDLGYRYLPFGRVAKFNFKYSLRVQDLTNCIGYSDEVRTNVRLSPKADFLRTP